MHRHRSGIVLAMFAMLISSPCISAAQGFNGDESIPAGCHPITAEERAGILAMNAQIPVNGMFCDKDKALLYGGCDTNPYPYLQTKNNTGRVDAVSGLNSDFACRMYKFLKAADAAGMNIRIGSGYRSVEMQSGMYNAWVAGGKTGPPVAPPGSSKHNFGLAVDLHYNGKTIGPRNTAQCVATIPACKWAHSTEAQFGLRWPMEYEPWHIEPSGTVNGRQQPLPKGGWLGDDTSTPYTNTNAPYDPSQWTSSMAPKPQQFSPLAGLGALSGYTQATPPTTQQPITIPAYDPIVIPQATTSVFEIPAPYVYPSTTAPTTTQSTAFDKLELISRGATSVSTSVSTPTSSSTPNNDSSDSTDASTNVGDVTETYEPLAISENSVLVNPIVVQETFSGNRPTETPQPTGALKNPGTPLIVALLTTLRDLLVSFVTALKSRPTLGFQGPWQLPQSAPVFR